jgi:hypothetical protein
LCPLGDRSAQTKQRERTVPCYLDLAQGKRHVGFCECLDHCFLGREPGRQSVHQVAAPAVVDFARPSLTTELAFRAKRAGQLASKMRFHTAQLDAYFTERPLAA